MNNPFSYSFSIFILYYVKSKSKGISYEKYIEVLNNQCCTLRNPKEKKDVKLTKDNDKEIPSEKNKNSSDNKNEIRYSPSRVEKRWGSGWALATLRKK